LQSLLHARYTPHLRTVSEPKFEQEPQPESQQITDPFAEFREILDDIRKLLASQGTKNDTNSKPIVLVEPDLLDEPEPEVVTELVQLQEVTPRPIEVEESPIEIVVDPQRSLP